MEALEICGEAEAAGGDALDALQGLHTSDRPPASVYSVLAAEAQPHCSDLYGEDRCNENT